MKINKSFAATLVAVSVAATLTTGCDESELYSADAPEWISQKVDSIAAVKAAEQSGADVIEGLMEDVYTVGATDYSSGWWAQFSKYYQIPENKKLVTQFNLHINPDAANTYKNFALILTNDVDRGGDGYKEYGAIRYDFQPSGNSEWGDYIDRSLATSNLEFATDTDKGIDKLGGKVTLTVDRSEGGLIVTITNGNITKTYTQKTALENLNADASNTTIRAFMVPEGSYIDFLGTTIEPIGGCTSALDKQPVSMVLAGVPMAVPIAEGLDVNEIMKGVTATVTFEEGVTKNVKAEDLVFMTIPDLTTSGDKQLIAAFSQSFKGEAAKPVMATANFKIVDFNKIEITPFTTYYSEDVYSGDIKFKLPKSQFEINGVNAAGEKTRFNDELIAQMVFEGDELVPEEGTKTFKGNWNGIETSVDVTFKKAEKVANTLSGTVGAEDKSTGWWSAFTDDVTLAEGKYTQVKFKNYCGGSNWNNFVVILRGIENQPEYAVVRADNYGWASGYDGNIDLTLSGGQQDWAAWLAAMDGSDVTITIANNGKTADVHCEMKGTDGNTYTQWYHNIKVSNPADFEFALTVDGSYIKF